jgi:hypothetical protein
MALATSELVAIFILNDSYQGRVRKGYLYSKFLTLSGSNNVSHQYLYLSSSPHLLERLCQILR